MMTSKLKPVACIDARTEHEKVKQARHDAWAARYKEWQQEHPEYANYRICEMLAKEFGATAQGISKRLKAMGIIKAQA